MSEPNWQAKSKVYRDELMSLRNTYSLLAGGVGRRGPNARLAAAFEETVREIDEAVQKGDAL